ncbi:MAG: helix-turn-helix domain-containing protein [Peptostreptococcales bacterium]
MKPSLEPLENTLYTIPEVATIIKTNNNYVYDLVKAGHLEALKLGRIKIRKSELERFLKQAQGYDYTDPFNIKELKDEVEE